MTVEVQERSVAKAGNLDEENEDRVAWTFDAGALRVAVADGATESSFSDLWAESLVRSWVSRPSPRVDYALCAASAIAWKGALPPSEDLPWYAQAKLEEGTHATFAGLRLQVVGGRVRWRSEVVGDCQVFVFKPAPALGLIRSAPASSSAEFGFHPALIGSHPATWTQIRAVEAAGRLRPPFEIWVTTDALAAACFEAVEHGAPAWSEWSAAMDHPDAFRSLVDVWRGVGRLRNDDTTVCRIRAT
jgi:hypothetical protein